MTRGGYVAAGHITKVRRLSDGRLAGFLGSAAPGSAYVRWLDAGGNGDPPDLADQATVVVISPSGEIALHEEGAWHPVEGAEFAAWGSGAAAALGALYCGATAVQAVEAAIRVDPGSGGAVQCVSLQPALRVAA
jgi:ATP-dependent protease HslVU (ClpYQ) peptidase subunit